MTDYMNKEQYQKACRYRMQETLENLAGIWHVPEEQIDQGQIEQSLEWLERMVEELKYFRQKITHAQSGPPRPGFIPEKGSE